jgi:hypothetical protein
MSKHNLFNTNAQEHSDVVFTHGGEFRRSGDSWTSYDHGQTTIPIPHTGKWYQEFTHVNQRPNDPPSIQVGIGQIGTPAKGYNLHDLRGYGIAKGTANSQYYRNSKTGQPAVTGAWTGVTGTTALGGVYMIAYDADAGKIWYGYNGTWLGSGDPAAGTNEGHSGIDNYWTWVFCAGRSTNDAGRWATMAVNPVPVYTPPTGFKTLTMDNITDTQGAIFNPQTTPNNASGYFKAITYTGSGDGNTNSVNVGFQPDLVLLKSRTQQYSWHLFDSLRGDNAYMNIDADASTEASLTGGNSFSFTSTGFDLTSSGGSALNESGQGSDNMMGYCWKIGGTSQVLTTGDIDTTVLANQDTGMSICRWSGNATPSNIPHGLSRKPDCVFVKNRDATTVFVMGGKVINHEREQASLAGPANSYIALSTELGSSTDSGGFTGFTDEFVQLGSGTTWNGSGTSNMMMYCWHSVPGYSQIGWYYSGPSGANGPFINCGFEPAMVLIKGLTTGRVWFSLDNERTSYLNPRNNRARWATNSTDAVTSLLDVDFLSNGFKIRGQDGAINTTQEYYWYMAFAKDAAKYGNAVAMTNE